MTVTVLGADGSYPGPGGACSGYLLSCDDTTVWLDAGSGTLANLQRHVQIEALDAVVISHEHPDHWTDLEHFLSACRWVIGRRGVPVFAPGGLRSLLRPSNDEGTLVWHDVADAEVVDIGPLRLTFSQTDHPVTTLAARIEAGDHHLGYTADTGPGWSLEALGPGLDLALCEATFLSDKEGRAAHLSARQAGLMAREAGVERLVITHVGPRVDRRAARSEAEAAFGRPVSVATIGERYKL